MNEYEIFFNEKMDTCLEMAYGFLGLIFWSVGVTLVASGDEARAQQRHRMNAEPRFQGPRIYEIEQKNVLRNR